MDHRHTNRIPVNLHATISGPNTAPLPAIVRNVCPDGMFIASAAIDAVQDRLLHVKIHGDRILPLEDVSALIVYRKAYGAGLLFVEDNPLYRLGQLSRAG